MNKFGANPYHLIKGPTVHINILKPLRSITVGQALQLYSVQHHSNFLSSGPFFHVAPLNTTVFCTNFRGRGETSHHGRGEVLIKYEILNVGVATDLFRKEKDKNIELEPYSLVSLGKWCRYALKPVLKVIVFILICC